MVHASNGQSLCHSLRERNGALPQPRHWWPELGGPTEAARELAYRLYNVCERRKRAQEALGYNALVISWPEIAQLAQAIKVTEQAALF